MGTCHEKFGPGVKSGPAGPILVGQNWSAPAKTGPIAICARMKLRLVIAAALQSRQLWTALMWGSGRDTGGAGGALAPPLFEEGGQCPPIFFKD